MKKSIRINYLYNVSYQILILLTPILTTPYTSRVLGAEGIGLYSFTASVVSYFALFAALGTSTYGQRQISYIHEDREERSRVFWNTVILRFMTVAVSMLIYFLFCMKQGGNQMYWILSINILTVAFDISWFLQGMEEFGKTVLRNVIFKLAGIIFIFVFVKSQNDLLVYAAGLVGLELLSNISLWFYLPRYINKPDLRNLHPCVNLKTVISLFIPTIAIQIYTVLDKTMIGIFSPGTAENGYYEQALKLSKMVLTLVTSLGTVMIPRIGYYFNHRENRNVEMYMYRGYNFVWFLGIPLTFGLIGISGNLVPWFLGAGYDKVIPLLCVLSFLVLAIGINNVTGMQYMIPTQRQNMFTLTVCIGAGVNFILNVFLIPVFYSIGAAIASVLAETVIALVQLYIVRKDFSVKRIFLLSKNYLIAGGLMFFVLQWENIMLSPSFLNTAIMMVSGACIYFAVLILLKDKFFKDNINRIAGSFYRKNKKGKNG